MLRSLILLLIAALPLLAKPESSINHFNKSTQEGPARIQSDQLKIPSQPAEYIPTFEVHYVCCARKKFGLSESIIAALKNQKFSVATSFEDRQFVEQHRTLYLVIRVLRI